MKTLFSEQNIKWIMTACSSGLIWLFGAWNAVLGILITVVVVDYLSGLMSAAKRKELSSKVGWTGLLKKAATFMVIIVAHQLDVALGNEENIIRNITALFYVSNELLSILENLGEMGVKLPEFLKEDCEKLKTKE